MEAYPLHWPQGRDRTPLHKRAHSRFDMKPDRARRELRREAERHGRQVVNAVAPRVPGPAPQSGSNFKYLGAVSADGVAPPVQLALDLGIKVEKNIECIEMGVLDNGTPYLTQAGVSRMSGAARATVFEITQEWEASYGEPIPPRGRKVLR